MSYIDVLKDLGFNEVESKIYFALLELKNGTAKQIAMKCDIPVNKIYHFLERMVDDGYVSMLPFTPKEYSLIAPKSKLAERLDQKRKALKDMESDVDQLAMLADQKNPYTPINTQFHLFKGHKENMEKLTEETFNAKKEILSCQAEWIIHKNSLHSIRDAIQRGVAIRMLGVLNDKTLERARIWQSLGVNVKGFNRDMEYEPLRFTIFDERVVRVSLGSSKTKEDQGYISFWVESESFAKVMKEVFTNIWRSAKSPPAKV